MLLDYRFYYAGNNQSMAYILSVDSNDVRSEGMSYGMMIAVQLDKQKEFDALFAWAQKYMQHNDPSDARYGYFAWHCTPAGSKIDQVISYLPQSMLIAKLMRL